MADTSEFLLNMFADPERVAASAESPPRYMRWHEVIQGIAGELLA